MATVDERISALKEKLKQEQEKKAKIEAKKRSAAAKKVRADDTRKKVLVGAVILARVERGEWPAEKLRDLMEKALSRADDRALFGLEKLPEQPASS